MPPLVIYLLLSYSKIEVNTRYTIPPKIIQLVQCTPLIKTGTTGLAKIQGNTSMAKSSDQSVEWYRDMIIQFIDN